MSSPSIKDQADFLRYLLARTKLKGGATSVETWMLLRGDEVRELERIQTRLERMAPHEEQIRKMVTKR